MKNVVIIALVCFTIISCQTEAPTLPTPTEWKMIEMKQPNLTVSVPEYFTIERNENGAVFRYKTHPSLAISWLTLKKSKSRGLWAKSTSTEKSTINGTLWNVYQYKHSDAIYYMNTISYVTLYNNKFLAVEFRIDSTMTTIQEQIITSITIEKE